MATLLEKKENIESLINELETMILNHIDREMLELVHDEELNRLKDKLEEINYQIENGN